MKIRLIYWVLTPQQLMDALIWPPPEALIVEMFKQIEIEKKDDETYMRAWLRHQCEINQIPYSFPAPTEIGNAIGSNTGALRFMLYITGLEEDWKKHGSNRVQTTEVE